MKQQFRTRTQEEIIFGPAPCGPVPTNFNFTVEEFRKIAGEGMTRKHEEVKPATADQVNEMVDLLDKVVIPQKTLEKWKNQAGIENWGEMTEKTIQFCIDYVKKVRDSAGSGEKA